MIRLHLLGRVELRLSDGSEPRALLSQPKPLALLAYLAAASPSGYRRREELLAVFWPELDSTRGRRALSQALHVIRSSLEEGAITSRGVEELGIDPDRVTSDVAEFRSAVSEEKWEAALSLYNGDLLAGFFIPGSPEFDQWADKERANLRSRATDAAWHLADIAETAGNPVMARDWGRRATEMEPYSEEALRRYVRLLTRSGNPAEAIKAYEDYRARIGRELDLEPSADTRQLVETLRDRDTQKAGYSRTPARPDLLERSISEAADAGSGRVPDVENATDRERIAGGDNFPPRRRQVSRLVLIGLPVAVFAAGAAFLAWRRTDTAQPAGTGGRAANRMIVADFTSDAADSALGSTVTEAIKLDLSGSHLIDVVSEAKARDALLLMRRDTGTRIGPDVAREIAVREGIKGVLEGDVRRTGGAFTLAARLISADDAKLIGGWRATARDSTELLQAIGTLSSAIRHDAGESIKAISASSPLFRVSTTSLLALRKHAMGMSAYYDEDFRRANSLFNEAIAIDSTFVDAYMMLAVSLAQLGADPAKQVEASIKAYKYRDRLGPAERYNVEAAYLMDVKGDVPGSIAAMYNAATVDPGIVFWGRLASQLLRERRYREAELAALRGLQWVPNPFLYRILANARFRQGKIADARETIEAATKVFPNSLLFPGARIDIAEAMGNYQLADSLAHALPRSRGSVSTLLFQGLTDALVGKVAEARSHLSDLRRVQLSRAMWEPSIRTTVQLARLDLALRRDTAGAIAVVDSGVAEAHWNEIDSRDRPYLTLAHFFLEAGRAERAVRLMNEFDRNVPPDFRARSQWLKHRDKAMLRVVRGDRTAADEIRVDIDTDPTPMTAMADLVWAYRTLGDQKSAESASRAYLAEVSSQRLEDDAFNLANILQFLEASALSHGSAPEAARLKARRTQLWRSADTELRARL